MIFNRALPGRLGTLGLLALALALAGCQQRDGSGLSQAQGKTMPGGDPETGRELLEVWGCGACHHIPGVTGADSLVGPPLDGWAQRQFIAGNLPNTPEDLVRWIMDPQEIEPGTAMPDLDVNEQTARHMGAYLYTLEDFD